MATRDFNPPGGVSFVIEHPADGFPEVIWILNNNEGEVQVGDAHVGDFIPPVSSDEEDESEVEAEEDNDEDTDEEHFDEEHFDEEHFDDEDWDALESEDSGYGSMSEEEEEEEDIEDEVDVDDDRYWPGCRYFPVPSLKPPAQPVERPEDLPPVSPRSEDCSPSLRPQLFHQEKQGGQLHTSGKCEEAAVICEDCDCEPRPSASGLSSATKRSREDSDTPQVSGKRQRKTCEDCNEEPRPSTSGHSSSTHRSGEEDYRNSAPSTSGSSSSMPRRYWPSSFWYQRRPDDSDSDED